MKDTRVFDFSKKVNKDELNEAASMIRDLGTVIFPTETVYGLGANALDKKSVLKIFEAKGRPSDNPLIVHITERHMLDDLVDHVPEVAVQLMDAFWPGALTIVFEKKESVIYEVTAGLETVAIRMPSHPIARMLIDTSGVPIAAPSANRSGKPSPTKGMHVVEDMSGYVDGIIVADPSEIGVESTVVSVVGNKVTLLRPGGVTMEALKSVVGKVEVAPNLLGVDKSVTPMSPGMKYRHYSPEGEVYLYLGDETKYSKMHEDYLKFSQDGVSVGVIGSEELKKFMVDVDILSYGSMKDLASIQRSIFHLLRECDVLNYHVILIEGVVEEKQGMAIMNRLRKAAKYIVE